MTNDNVQVFDIPLDSPLEVDAEHNIVPVSSPSFSYNTQSPVSGLLMNAVKYEGDGVFCGNYLYDYDVKYTYKVEGSEFSGLEISHPDPDNPKYNPSLIHPNDVSRNFYWYEESLKYAVDVSFTNTRRLFNLGFVSGFLKDNILSGSLGNELKVDRTNADGVNEAGAVELRYDMIGLPSPTEANPDATTIGKMVPDGADKYIITGKTFRNNLDFRLAADVYGRILEDQIETDTGAADGVRSFIPRQYDAALTFGLDKINCQVVHETRDQDNIAVVMPALLLNETGKDLFVGGVEKIGNTGGTRLNFEKDATELNDKYTVVPNGFADIGGLSSVGLSQAEHTRQYSGTLNEYDEVFVRNIDRIYPDEQPSYTLEGTEELEVTVGEAVTAVEWQFPIPANANGCWSAAPSESLRNVTLSSGGSVNVILVSKAIVDQAWFGRNTADAPSYWQGLKGTPGCLIRIDTTSRLVENKPEFSQILPNEGIDTIWVDIPPAFQKAGWANRVGFKRHLCAKKNQNDLKGMLAAELQNAARGFQNYGGTMTWDGSMNFKGGGPAGLLSSNCGSAISLVNAARVDWPASVQVSSIAIGGQNPQRMYVRLSCNDIESGDWSAVNQAVSATAQLLVAYNSVTMNDDLCSGTIKIGINQQDPSGNTQVSTGQKFSSKAQDLGVVFEFIPVKVKYISDIRFKRSRRDSITLMQGDQFIKAKVEFQPWDFFNTLTSGDGVTIPNTVVNQPEPIPPNPPYIDTPPSSIYDSMPQPPVVEIPTNLPSLPDPVLPSAPMPPQPPVAEIPVYQGWTPIAPDPPLPWPTLDSFGTPPPGAVTPPSTVTPPPPSNIPNPLPNPTVGDLPFNWDTPINYPANWAAMSNDDKLSWVLGFDSTQAKPGDWDALTDTDKEKWLDEWAAGWIANWQAAWIVQWQQQLVVQLTAQWQQQWMQQIGIPAWQQQQQNAWKAQWQADWIVEWNVEHPIITPQELPDGWDSWSADQKYVWWQTVYVATFIDYWQSVWIDSWRANDPATIALLEQWASANLQFQQSYIDNYVQNVQNAWIADWRQQQYNEWVSNFIAQYKAQWLADWHAANVNVGWVHRQCVWITFYGLSDTEVLRRRYVISLPIYRNPAVSGRQTQNPPDKEWSAMVMSYSTVERQGFVRTTGRLFDMKGLLAANAKKEPQIGTDLKPIAGTWMLGYGAQRTDMSNANSAYGSGYTNGTLLYDNTLRRMRLRRGFILSSSGQMRGASIVQMAGPLDNMDVRFDTPLQGLSVLRYNNGSFDFDAAASDPGYYELSYDQDYQRILQFSDGSWAKTQLNSSGDQDVVHEFMTNIELQLIELYEYYQTVANIDPEVIGSLLQIIWYVYEGASTERIRRFVTSSAALQAWSGLAALNAILQSYSGLSANVSDNGDVYRLVFRDSDKAAFDFFPKGIFQRSNPNIRYLGYNTVLDPITKEVSSAKIIFDYSKRNPVETVKEAAVTVYAEDFYGKPGRGYTSVEAHDITTGKMEALQLANPDLDYAFITTQFDTELYTENMFYLDKTHILKCTSRAFILLEKNDEDEWVERKSSPRSAIIGDDVEALKYGVTSAVEQIPMLYVITSAVESVDITLFPLDRFSESDYFDNYVIRYKKTVNVQFTNAVTTGFSSARLGFIGTPPPSVFFVNSIQVTSTRIDNSCLIGIVYDKGVHQWTVVINTSTSSKSKFVFNGYGCVGIDGTVTGSAVPMFAMNARSGISVVIRDKPDIESGFKMNRAAYVSGQSLVFSDSKFNRGICVSAKLRGNRFVLKSLPLAFSRHALKKQASKSGSDKTMKMKFVAFPNFGFIYFVATWAWAVTACGLSMNSWVTSSVLDEAEDFMKLEAKQKSEGEPPNDFWIKLALALLMGVTERAGNAGAAKLGKFIDEKTGRIDNQLLYDNETMNKTTRTVKKKDDEGNEVEEEVDNRLIPFGEKNKFFAKLDEIERKTRTPGKVADAVINDIKTVFSEIMSGSGGSVVAPAASSARIGCSMLYSVGPSQNVWAGPGFTQIHFTQGSRISGSHCWAEAAKGDGATFVPRIPPIPLPYMGPLDINHNGVVGVHPMSDFSPVFDINPVMQPNFNVGSKHLVYSYPTLDIQDHDIRQTQFAPILREETATLYESEFKKREYSRQILDYMQWNEEELVVDNCSIVQGVDSYHSGEQQPKIPILTDSGYPTFATPGTFDYCVYPSAELYYTATAGAVTGVSIRDTLVMDGEPSNVVIKNGLPLIASPYTTVDVVRTLNKDTIRPIVFSGDTLLFRTTGLNVIKGLQVMHGCDGYSNRVAKLVGTTAVDGEVVNQVYSHIKQGPTKTGSMFPPVTYIGKFDMVPIMDTYLQPINVYATHLNNLSLATENLQGFRYAVPIVHKSLGLLPAAIQTYAPYKVHVIDGVTSLTTDLRSTTALSKAPEAHDFVVYGNTYRVNGEYISKLQTATGTTALQDVVATLGLRYVGSTPQQAWFYTSITNGFYVFTMSNPTIGATSMQDAGHGYRFKEVETGTWDFISQEVAFKTLLDRDVDIRHDAYKDIVRLKNKFLGMIAPPNANTVWPKTGYFDLDSTGSGIAIRGKHRSQVNMYVWHDSMFREQINKSDAKYGVPGYSYFTGEVNDGLEINHGHWDKIKGDRLEDFYTQRNYDWNRYDKIYGYFLEPFKLATAFLGLEESTDCLFEWEITFAMTPMMRRIIRDKYVIIYLAGETQLPGGGAYSVPTRLYLTADHFGRTRVEGALTNSENKTTYYTFRYNARNGAGNSEKLYIWSDGCAAIKQIKLYCSVVTEQRAAPLVTQIDIKELQEL